MFRNPYFYFQSGRWRAGCRTLRWPSSPCRTSPPDSQSSGSWWYRKPAGRPVWENSSAQLLHSRGFTLLLLCTGKMWLKLGRRGNSRWHCFASQQTGTSHLKGTSCDECLSWYWLWFPNVKEDACSFFPTPVHVNTRAATLDSCLSKHFAREKCLHTRALINLKGNTSWYNSRQIIPKGSTVDDFKVSVCTNSTWSQNKRHGFYSMMQHDWRDLAFCFVWAFFFSPRGRELSQHAQFEYYHELLCTTLTGYRHQTRITAWNPVCLSAGLHDLAARWVHWLTRRNHQMKTE